MKLRWMAFVLAACTCVGGFLHRRGFIFESPASLNNSPIPSAEHRSVPRPFVPFTLIDVFGNKHIWSEFETHRAVVVVFVGNECPLVQFYARRLSELLREFEGQRVGFLAINSNSQDSLEEMSRWSKRLSLPFPVYKDIDQRVADNLGVTRTPEALLLTPNKEIVYQGRIDDQYDIGLLRSNARHSYLRDAIVRFLDRKPIEVGFTKAPGCLIGRIKAATSKPTVTFANDIAPIVERRCATCHQPGEIAPFSMLDYEEIASWGPMIQETVLEDRMPPWPAREPLGHFVNDKRLLPREKELLLRWIEEGCAEGVRRSSISPPQPASADGWHIGKPDLVYSIGERPFELPASGDIDYQFYTVDLKLMEDRWIQAIEFLPGNRAVVHHAAVTLAYPEVMKKSEFGFYGFAPGSGPMVLPAGRAIHVPAGSLLKFQIHYTPIGTPTTDQSRVGLKFTDPQPDLLIMVPYGAIASTDMVIPANAKNHDVWAVTMIEEDYEVWGIFPHMHLRGKSAMIEALLPDASVKRLLTVPKWDFNWQFTYELKEPIRLPAGTLIHMRAVFDNSSDNSANPDPNKAVRWGRMTRDEMWVIMLNGFEVKGDRPVESNSSLPMSQH
ncbi:redoxin domain-containing protein [bacterium]|nr:redoxin domain-containing protein [bacterium]